MKGFYLRADIKVISMDQLVTSLVEIQVKTDVAAMPSGVPVRSIISITIITI